MSFLSHLECTICGEKLEADQLWNLCPSCKKPILVRYDLQKARHALRRKILIERKPDLWRYHELLPVQNPGNVLTLGEGFTPLIHVTRLGKSVGFDNLFIKDEGQNPTGSFKARGLAVGLSRASELGVKEVSIPSAGNAATALSAYAAFGGMKAYVFMPRNVPGTFVTECLAMGADVQLVDGLINDCGRVAAEGVRQFGRFDMSTLKEPYRIEGKKTMGFELAEQMGWELPDVIIYPTGGGTGLIGMWKAFDEMEELDWVNSKRPRMVVVQSEGCAPIVRAFNEVEEFARTWEGANTIAEGLCVPVAIGDFLVLRILRESHGTAIAVSDDAIIESMKLVGRTQGLFCCPEGAATLVAFKRLRKEGWIKDNEKVLLFNTATGLKYVHLLVREG